MASGSQGAQTCERCGALNGAGFARCVRCGQALSLGASLLDRIGQRPDPEALWASKTIISATVVVFAFQIWIAQIHDKRGPFEALLRPTTSEALRFGALHASLVASEPFRLVSSVFVHFGALHLVGNMFFLAWLGRIAEPAVGSARFVMAYVSTGILGFLASTMYTLLVEGGASGITAGASGAVFGISGLVLGMLVRQKNPKWKRFAVQTILFNVLVGLTINQARVGIMINNAAHVGGLIAGLAWGVALAKPAKAHADKAPDGLPNLGAAFCLVLCLSSLVLAQRSPTWKALERRAQPGYQSPP